MKSILYNNQTSNMVALSLGLDKRIYMYIYIQHSHTYKVKKKTKIQNSHIDYTVWYNRPTFSWARLFCNLTVHSVIQQYYIHHIL